MNAKNIVGVLGLKVEHALYRDNGYWYHHLKRFPGILVDAEGYVVFETRETYLENQHLQHAQTLHVKNGISSIPGYVAFTEEQQFKLMNFVTSAREDNESTLRKKRLIDVILRNKKRVEKLKKIYDNKCQLCELKLIAGRDQFYSEVHHVVPLGNPHNGADIMENMICVCPNCHVQLDLGAIKLDTKLKSTLHRINEHFIDYHNRVIYQKKYLV